MPKGFPNDLAKVARRKLRILASATRLEDLRQYSIRVNDQWRVCFVWQDGDADDVEVVDYH